MTAPAVPLRCSLCGLLHEGGSIPAARGQLNWCVQALGREVARLSEQVRDMTAAGGLAPRPLARQAWDCGPCVHAKPGECRLGLVVPEGGCPEFRPAASGAAAAEAPDCCDHGVPMSERCSACASGRRSA